MSVKRIAGIVCLVLALISMASAISRVSHDVNITDPSGLGFSRAVGTFLPSVLLLIISLWLFKKPKSR